MRIIDMNPRMATLMRVEPDQMIGMPVAAYLDPSEFTRVFDLFQPLWNGDIDSLESDSRAVRGDRTSAWLHWSATTVRNAAGRIEYFLAMYEDTDAQHAANEAATAHLAGIERLNHLKSEFITLVSHEFRTGLVGIQGFSEMIRDSEDLAKEDIKAFAADINKDAQRLNRMINDMLDLDRIEAGRLTLRMEPVDINVVLQDAVDRMRASSDRHVFDGQARSGAARRTMRCRQGCADRRQPAYQRGQVLAGRRRDPGLEPVERRVRRGERARPRRRHRPGVREAALQPLRALREDERQDHRHRAWSRDRSPDRRDARRPDLGRHHGRFGVGLPVHAPNASAQSVRELTV